MRAHFGMRPHDIVILLRVITLKGNNWQYRDLAASLYISVSEISESLYRSQIAGLVDASRKRVNLRALLEFIEYGLHYVFPVVPGTMVTGIPTAHSQKFFKEHIHSELDYVWPSEKGWARGLSIAPLHKGVPDAAQLDEIFHSWLAAIDVIRVGKSRELKLAIDLLNHDIKKYGHL